MGHPLEEDNGLGHVFMALTNVKSGREEDFHDWYDTEHVPDVVAVSCYRSGRRFQLFGAVGATAPWEFLSLYRFVGPAAEMHEILEEHGDAGNATLTDALVDDDGAWVYRMIEGG
jgi:hypothetical protein